MTHEVGHGVQRIAFPSLKGNLEKRKKEKKNKPKLSSSTSFLQKCPQFPEEFNLFSSIHQNNNQNTSTDAMSEAMF